MSFDINVVPEFKSADELSKLLSIGEFTFEGFVDSEYVDGGGNGKFDVESNKLPKLASLSVSSSDDGM